MSTQVHTDAYKKTVCEQLGENIDDDLCAEVEEHLAGCPDCRAQFDSVGQTVKIYKRTHPALDQPPHEVQERLYKVLKIAPPSV